MKLWAIIADTAGAWEAECVYSVWDNSTDAENELHRLYHEEIAAGCNGGEFHLEEIETNVSSNTWIGGVTTAP